MKLFRVPTFLLVALVASVAVERSQGMDPKSKAEGQRVKVLFESMRSGNYAAITFPQLDLADVPTLLEYADSTKPLRSFPRNPLSSQLEVDFSEGMVALWLIEGVRQGDRYPSLNALCFKAGGGGKDWSKASEDNHKEVARAYRAWWEKAKSLPHDPAKALDPLKGTGLAWRWRLTAPVRTRPGPLAALEIAPAAVKFTLAE